MGDEARLVKPGKKPEHSCRSVLSGNGADQDAVYLCVCGKFWQYAWHWDYDDGDYWIGWVQVRDAEGTPLELVPRAEYFTRSGLFSAYCTVCGSRGFLWGHDHEIWR